MVPPLDVCEQRDRKGLYAKARAGIVKNFTGISAGHCAAARAPEVIDTADLNPEEAAQLVILDLERRGFTGGRRFDTRRCFVFVSVCLLHIGR